MDGVIVLGAGLAGLGCARHLRRSRVFEALPHPGGHAYSEPQGGVHFDEGAHICHSKDTAFTDMISRAAGEVVATPRSVVRNRWRGNWLTYPVQNHLRELPQELRIRALTDLVQAHCRKGDEPRDYRDWCLAQYGSTLTDTFYEEFTAKYWRVPMTDLATDWLGGRLIPSQIEGIVRGAFESPSVSQAVFNRFLYPAHGGFFGFFESLYKGLDITYRRRAVEIDPDRRRVRFDDGTESNWSALVSTIALPELVRITSGVPDELREAAVRLRCTQLLCVNLVVARPELTDAHWFYVYDPEIDTARVSVPSNLAPGSVPAGCTALQAEILRRDDEPMEIDLLVERTAEQLSQLMGFDRSEIRHLGHRHVRRAYTISDSGRAGIVAALTEWFEGKKIYLAGLFGRWKYVWSDEAYRQGREVAQSLAGLVGSGADFVHSPIGEDTA